MDPSSHASLTSSPSNELRPMPRTRKDSDVSDDTNVQATNDDASESKYSAVTLGYWNDPFIAYFVRRAERKSPEIHRGYYGRVKAVRMIVDNFLAAHEDKSTQIINLGCGFDTLYWQLRNSGDNSRMPHIFVDVDFSTVTAKKIHHILKPSAPLRKSVVDESESIGFFWEVCWSCQFSVSDDKIREVGHKCLYGPIYRLVGADIRDISELNRQLTEAGVDFDRPTLFIAECVLVYMTPDQGNTLIKYASDRFSRSYFLYYDPVSGFSILFEAVLNVLPFQVNMKDKFGDIFKENMYTRGLLLAGVDACGDLDSQVLRFRNNGWGEVQAWTLRDIYSKFLPREEITRYCSFLLGMLSSRVVSSG